jgi:EAL domain-containing protein (putative c-di-GMP-specific phosphodiesterase class I)
LNAAAQQIAKLQKIGVRTAIDHFGVGTSSFTALHRLPVNSLKIDRSILTDLQHSREAASLLHGLAVIVRDIGISLIAVGIEETEQLIALQEFGCDLAQGKYFGTSMPAAEVLPFLHDQSRQFYQTRGAAAFATLWSKSQDGQATPS